MGGGDLSGAGRKLGGAGDRDPGKGGAVDCLLCRRRTTPRIAVVWPLFIQYKICNTYFRKYIKEIYYTIPRLYKRG